MVNGVTASEELGEHPKDAASARDTEGTLRGKSRVEWASPLEGFGGWGQSQLVYPVEQFRIDSCVFRCVHTQPVPEIERTSSGLIGWRQGWALGV